MSIITICLTRESKNDIIKTEVKKVKKIFPCILIAGMVFLNSCTIQSSIFVTEPKSKSFFAMDTYMTITAYGANAEIALNQAENKIAELEKLWSVTDENSEIYAINHSHGKSIQVSSETAELLDFSLNISEMTSGALDCTMYPILTEWGFTTSNYKIPTDAKINELLENTGYEKINMNGNNITVPKNMQIDMGAVGKGYTGDLIADILRENGIESALLDLGGNIQTIGIKTNGTKWKLGLRSPFDEGLFATLEVSECAVITSGGYERYFVGDDGETYWHILDPKTGKPAHSGLISVTVVGKEGRLCDALSTSIFVMGLDNAVKLWKEFNNFEMILVTDKDEIYLTESIEKNFSLNQMYENLQVEVIQR
ncbi:MAG: FAD:protein FMN transferase [Ruminococcus sp.]|nr:FAD:protein FMN transferase [Ruminococcus sp.]